MFLHETGSNNPLGINSRADKVVFFPYYMRKDFLGFFMCAGVLILFFFRFPGYFMEYQKYIQANSLVTPPHIQPE
jgi:ubiquinol-cytochrome c reductase cytochrome b subunit